MHTCCKNVVYMYILYYITLTADIFDTNELPPNFFSDYKAYPYLVYIYNLTRNLADSKKSYEFLKFVKNHLFFRHNFQIFEFFRNFFPPSKGPMAGTKPPL